MKKQMTKNTLENYLTEVDAAVRDTLPGNSRVVNNLQEIMRLAIKGYELETSESGPTEVRRIAPRHRSVAQLGIR